VNAFADVAWVALKAAALLVPYLIGWIVIGIYAVIQIRNASDKVRAIRRAIRAEIDKENVR
jgi:fucose 4-O-acetylase-like acetyltransferase